jgi:Methyltransferase domain
MIVEGMETETTMGKSPEFIYDYFTSGDQWSDIQDHLPMLRKNAKGRVLEIGVRTGISTAALLCGVKENGGHVTSIDIEDCNIFAGDKDWTFVKADSRQPSLRIQSAFDMVLIDGDHSYYACLNDLLRFGSRSPLIFLHDYDMSNVKNAVEQFMKDYPSYTLTVYYNSFGMAKLEREHEKSAAD